MFTEYMNKTQQGGQSPSTAYDNDQPPTHPPPPPFENSKSVDPFSPALNSSFRFDRHGYHHNLDMNHGSFRATESSWIPASFRPAYSSTRFKSYDISAEPQSHFPPQNQSSIAYANLSQNVMMSFEPRQQDKQEESIRLFSWIKNKPYKDDNKPPMVTFADAFNNPDLDLNATIESEGVSDAVQFDHNSENRFPELPKPEIRPPPMQHAKQKKENAWRHDNNHQHGQRRPYQSRYQEQKSRRKAMTRNVGPPTEEMLAVREKILRNKKQQPVYRTFSLLPIQVDSNYPRTPDKLMPCTQSVFREEVDLWFRQIRTYNDLVLDNQQK